MEMRLILASNIERINSRFNVARIVDEQGYVPSYNISTGQHSYVICNNQNRQLDKYVWGIKGINHNSEPLSFIRSEGDRNKNDDPNYTGTNAVFLNPQFRKILNSQRCIILADAFVVNLNENPYLVHLRENKRPFALAGLWREFIDESGNKCFQFAIFSTTSNSLLQSLGQKRMPVILPIEKESKWLRISSSLTGILDCLYPYPYDLMNAYPVTNEYAKTNINNASLVQRKGNSIYPESKQRVIYKKKRKEKSNSTISWAERVKQEKGKTG